MNALPQQTVATPADPWEAVFDAATDLDRFAPDWDGEGADPVPPGLIQEAIEVLAAFRGVGYSIPAAIYPVADGTVMVEWHHQDGTVESVNVRGNGRLEIVTSVPGRQPVFEVLDLGGPATDAGGQPVPECDPFQFDLAA